MIYEIYMGIDNKVKNIIDEKKFGVTESFKKAMDYYNLAKEKCEKLYNDPKYYDHRLYCYMVRIDTDKKLYGYINGKQINNGYFSETYYYNNYFHNYEYYQDFTIENGKRYPE